MRSLLFAVVVMLAGCSAKYPEGVLACTKQSDCPSNWVCRIDRYCHSTPARSAAGEEASAGNGGAGGGLDILKHF
jgi:hypothetical protein